MYSPELPFEVRGGQTEQAAIHNRIAAIERINYLTNVDLRKKSPYYLQVLDVEMWRRWYSDEPPQKMIDEEFCQRAAIVIKDIEENRIDLSQANYKQAFMEHAMKKDASNADKQSKDNKEPSPKTS